MFIHRTKLPDKVVGRQPETLPLVCKSKPTSFQTRWSNYPHIPQMRFDQWAG